METRLSRIKMRPSNAFYSQPASSGLCPKKMIDIRQHDQYSLRNTIRAGCIHECWLFFNELAKGAASEKVRRDLADGIILGNYAYSTRMALWEILRTRYVNI